nr:MAG TPA: hypothetical protein [Crassvirales sp.]
MEWQRDGPSAIFFVGEVDGGPHWAFLGIFEPLIVSTLLSFLCLFKSFLLFL